MRFNLVVISTPHMPRVRCFDDVVWPLYYALRRLGHEAAMSRDDCDPKAANILFGAVYDPEQKWHAYPESSIVYNLEQMLSRDYAWDRDRLYLDLLKRHQVWDFSRQNIDVLKAHGIEAKFLPIAYAPEMRRLKPDPSPDLDVLFYGAMTHRRRLVLDELRADGYDVLALGAAYGLARDHALRRCRVFLNIHHSRPASLEIVRLAYALANAKAVVSECNADTDRYPELGGACLFRPYEDLAAGVREILADTDRREAQAAAGFEIFSRLSLTDALEKIVGHGNLPTSAPVVEPLPKLLNIGPSFRNDALNIHADAAQNPDLALDLERPLDFGAEYSSARFGAFRLAPKSFGAINAADLWGRLKNREAFLRNARALLADDGELILSDKFDSGFSEIFFHGRPDFALKNTRRALSDLGRVLTAKGRTADELIRTPGAVTHLQLTLVKKEAAPDKREVIFCAPPEAADLSRACYLGPAVNWETERPPLLFPPPAPLPSASSLRFEIWRLLWRRLRYRFSVKFGPARKKGRYADKLLPLEERLARLRNLLRLYENS